MIFKTLKIRILVKHFKYMVFYLTILYRLQFCETNVQLCENKNIQHFYVIIFLTVCLFFINTLILKLFSILKF